MDATTRDPSSRDGPSEVASLEVREGYEFRFLRTSPGFVRWAVPAEPGISGTRRFCVDARGVVLQYYPGDTWSDPVAPEADCPPAGVPVDAPHR